MGISTSGLFYNQTEHIEKKGNTEVALSISYFNAVACAWEPAVEKFTVRLEN